MSYPRNELMVSPVLFHLPRERAVSRLNCMANRKIDFSHLSPEERIQLAEDLWDSLASMPEQVPVPEAHIREVDRRLDAYRQDGDPGLPWPEVLDRIEARPS